MLVLSAASASLDPMSSAFSRSDPPGLVRDVVEPQALRLAPLPCASGGMFPLSLPVLSASLLLDLSISFTIFSGSVVDEEVFHGSQGSHERRKGSRHVEIRS